MKSSRTRLAKTIAAKSLKNGPSRRLAQEVAAYLLAEGRVNELSSILRDVQADWAEAGYMEVIATSAHDLTPEVKRQITAQIKRLYPQAKQIIVTSQYDPQIIGGVRLQAVNQQLDLSVATKLNKFKQLSALSN